MNNLAFIHAQTGEYAKALPLYEQVLAQRTATLGAENPQTVRSMNNLALVFEKTGQVQQAVPLYKRALEVSRNRIGSSESETQTITENLARAKRASAAAEEAASLHDSSHAAAKQAESLPTRNVEPNKNRLASLPAMGETPKPEKSRGGTTRK